MYVWEKGQLNECKRLMMWIKDGEYMGLNKLDQKDVYL